VIGSARPASAGDVASTKQQAAALGQRLNALAAEESAASQQFDLAQIQVQQLSNRIRESGAIIARDQRAIGRYRSTLQAAAVNAYVDSGSVASTNPLFATNANQLGATSVYNQVAQGNLSGSVANLTNAQANLAADQRQLNNALRSAERARAAERNQIQHLSALKVDINNQLRAADAAVQAALHAQQLAAVAAAQATFSQSAPSVPAQNFPAPPPDSRGAIAADAALTQLGVPYVWAASTPRGSPGDSSGAFDCSGLTMWAWGQAGVSLSHYSGAQMAESTPVPISNLQPGDLLFYGPGGSQHVAMYLGSGKMIEAPYTGASVWVTPVRLGYGFAGAGRP